MHDLHRGERLDVQPRRRLADGAQHVGVVLERQPGVQAAHDVDLGGARLGGLRRLVPDLLDGVLVRAFLAALAVERAERAGQRADVRVVQVAVDVVVGHVAVEPAPHQVRERAHGPDVGCLVQQDPVVHVQAAPVGDLPDYRPQPLIEPRNVSRSMQVGTGAEGGGHGAESYAERARPA